MTNDALIIACTLDPQLVRERFDDWIRLVRSAEAIDHTERGIRLRFARDGDVRAADVAALTEAERDCCPFFTFTLEIDDAGLALAVGAGPEARPLVDVLLGLEERRG